MTFSIYWMIFFGFSCTSLLIIIHMETLTPFSGKWGLFRLWFSHNSRRFSFLAVVFCFLIWGETYDFVFCARLWLNWVELSVFLSVFVSCFFAVVVDIIFILCFFCFLFCFFLITTVIIFWFNVDNRMNLFSFCCCCCQKPSATVLFVFFCCCCCFGYGLICFSLKPVSVISPSIWVEVIKREWKLWMKVTCFVFHLSIFSWFDIINFWFFVCFFQCLSCYYCHSV